MVKDYAKNQIRVYGNKEIQATHREVMRRLSEDHLPFSQKAIGEVFYGLAGDAAILGRKQTSADWVWFSDRYGDGTDDLTIDSGSNTPDQLLNHIAWFYSKVDPDCVLHNWYSHDLDYYIGCSYRRVKNHKIRNFERHIYVEKEVCSEADLGKALAQGRDAISWLELGEIHSKLDSELRIELINEFPEVSRYFLNRR
jgi:hypothetical protein